MADLECTNGVISRPSGLPAEYEFVRYECEGGVLIGGWETVIGLERILSTGPPRSTRLRICHRVRAWLDKIRRIPGRDAWSLSNTSKKDPLTGKVLSRFSIPSDVQERARRCLSGYCVARPSYSSTCTSFAWGFSMVGKVSRIEGCFRSTST
jgi:hypothetical protein